MGCVQQEERRQVRDVRQAAENIPGHKQPVEDQPCAIKTFPGDSTPVYGSGRATPTSRPENTTVDVLNHECTGTSVEAGQWSGQIGQQDQRQGPLCLLLQPPGSQDYHSPLPRTHTLIRGGQGPAEGPRPADTSGGDAHDLQVNKRRIESGQEEADSLLVLPALPQTLAHWLRPAPPSTLPTERNISAKQPCLSLVNDSGEL
ncbi:hypothetical protein NQZ68_007915 [Dissostichus eleginoides]|nr:hypothetical protein NQZ68_007915 [Dissostichus eleginoides]